MTMDQRALHVVPHLSVLARLADAELARIHGIIEHKVLVDGRGDLEELFGRLLAMELAVGPPATPKTLDLIGHSTPGKSLLTLGDWVIDASSPTVTAFFRELAEQDVLPRLGIYAVRLLGCQTADTGHGRATICRLSEILGLEVFGTNRLIYAAHYGAAGFRSDAHHTLVCSSDLRRCAPERDQLLDCARYPRVLDIDSLPSAPLIVREHPWPRRIVNLEIAGRILNLVRRTEGAEMPGLLTEPSYELALPAMKPNWYHRAQVLLDGEFVRVYPEGDRRPGVVFPVDDPHALRTLVESIPPMSSD